MRKPRIPPDLIPVQPEHVLAQIHASDIGIWIKRRWKSLGYPSLAAYGRAIDMKNRQQVHGLISGANKSIGTEVIAKINSVDPEFELVPVVILARKDRATPTPEMVWDALRYLSIDDDEEEGE